MRNVALIIAPLFLLSTATFAGEGTGTKKSHKKVETTNSHLTDKFSTMLGYPSYILDGATETVMISYSVDENNIIHVQEISSSNAELKKYVLKHLEGKKMKNMQMEGKSGVVKVQFSGTKRQKLNFQF